MQFFPDYQPFEKASPSPGYFGTKYDKQIRYHRVVGVKKCHRKLVREELVWNIKLWKQYDEIILLITDAKRISIKENWQKVSENWEYVTW